MFAGKTQISLPHTHSQTYGHPCPSIFVRTFGDMNKLLTQTQTITANFLTLN